MIPVIPVILAGGAGTRLWPLSRQDKPKQFHNLSGRGTLLEETIKRLLPIEPAEAVIATAEKYRSLTQAEIDRFNIRGTVLCEPRPRNTAAAILYAALYLDRAYDDSLMLVLPADHFIRDSAGFTAVLKTALDQADQQKLVTIGITPTYPETGYGYIKSEETSGMVRNVDRFVEKPDIELAMEYVASGSYFWNSGIFAWKTSVILEAFKTHLPAHAAAFSSLAALDSEKIASMEPDVWEIKKDVFDSLDSISIDYGILEKCGNRVVIPGDFGWADLGSWKAIDDILDPDEAGNRGPDRDRHIYVNSENCSVFSESKRVSLVGLKDIVVVETEDEILVIHKDSSQDVRDVVDIVKEREGK